MRRQLFEAASFMGSRPHVMQRDQIQHDTNTTTQPVTHRDSHGLLTRNLGTEDALARDIVSKRYFSQPLQNLVQGIYIIENVRRDT